MALPFLDRSAELEQAKLTATAREVRRFAERLARDAARCPELAGRRCSVAIWVLRGAKGATGVEVVSADDVIGGS